MSPSRREVLRALLSAAGGLGLTRFAAAPPFPVYPFPMHTELRPYRVDFSREAVADLHTRLDRTRWLEPAFDAGWEAGTDLGMLRDLVHYWRYEYDWFQVQSEMNELRHLRGPVEGEGIHCVVYPAARASDHPPLLLLHGWPGSFWEFHRAAPLLASGLEGAPAFDVVVPSLPGFVFSDAPREPGMNPARVAERLHLLMEELGFSRYGLQGGDWGAIIATQMARQRREAVAALHISFVASAPGPPDGVPASEAEQRYRTERARFQSEETGYSSIQGTRPQSLAVGLQDSPVGWLAWILEKYWAWSDHGGELWTTFTRDDLLTTAMLYWMPGKILSSSRIYYETTYRPRGPGIGGRVTVPTGYARYPAEPWSPPPEVVERSYDLVHVAEFDRGGHFPALEQPRLWAHDVASFFAEHG